MIKITMVDSFPRKLSGQIQNFIMLVASCRSFLLISHITTGRKAHLIYRNKKEQMKLTFASVQIKLRNLLLM